MAVWRVEDPPLGIEIEYERDDGVVVKGALRPAGKFGLGDIASGGKLLRRQYVSEGHSIMFEIKRWRELESD